MDIIYNIPIYFHIIGILYIIKMGLYPYIIIPIYILYPYIMGYYILLLGYNMGIVIPINDIWIHHGITIDSPEN